MKDITQSQVLLLDLEFLPSPPARPMIRAEMWYYSIVMTKLMYIQKTWRIVAIGEHNARKYEIGPRINQLPNLGRRRYHYKNRNSRGKC